jgi:hypothetical protein
MPALPSKQARRKGATPVTNLEQSDVWRRILDVMGLEPLRENQQQQQQQQQHSPTTMDTEAAEPMAAPTTAASEPPARKVTILDLPSETQKDIFKHVSFPDAEENVVLHQNLRVHF